MIEHLQKDPDLNALRQRADFRQLLQSCLDAAPPPKRQLRQPEELRKLLQGWP
jgi:hypothetical protein